jgi:hypothetical protein
VALLILSVICGRWVVRKTRILITVTRNGHEHDYGKEVRQNKLDG